ncbi:MAG: DUF3179 domain-containing protein [Pseudomonadales bacterium]|nr:DUF3179 domain-containing protein [Pseudomonadales bacterium]
MNNLKTRLINSALARPIIYIFLLIILAPFIGNQLYAQKYLNGFNISNSTIPAEQIMHGGPPRDGIPALNNPVFISAAKMLNLKPQDKVLGLSYNGEVKAYPIRILDYHEIVNDHFGDKAVLISYCPLCGTGMAFNATIDNKTLRFSVSGLLYNSDVLMYDKHTDSLWSQILMQAISGPFKGQQLKLLPMEHSTWQLWIKRYPETQVLSFDTGYLRNYQQGPYGDYAQSRQLYFPIAHHDKRYHPKEITLGISINGHHKAYPFIELADLNSPLVDKINQHTIKLYFDKKSRTARAVDINNRPIAILRSYWFAWYTFHPDTLVFNGDIFNSNAKNHQ